VKLVARAQLVADVFHMATRGMSTSFCTRQLHVHVVSSVPDHNTVVAPVTHPGGGEGRRPRSGARPRSLIASLKHANGSLMMLLCVWCVFV
jgi:hypothetical protein